MTARIFKRYFESFRGEDLRSTDLTKETNYAKSLANYQFGEGASIRGIPGIQALGQAGAFLGLHTYSYTNTDTGANEEQLLAINDLLWRLDTAVMPITGGSNMNHTIRVNSATNSYRMVINSGATPYLFGGNPYIDLGTGLEDLPFTMEDLRAVIDAHASLACATPTGMPFARVNGNQTGVSTITVDAGHTFVVNFRLEFFDYATNKLTWRRVTAITGTTITFDSAYGTVNVKDNQVLGPLSAPAAQLSIADSYTSTSSGIDLNMVFWSGVNYTSDYYTFGQSPFRALWETRDDAGWTHPCFINANNVCYIHTTGAGYGEFTHDGYPHKYDGSAVYREGMPYAPSPLGISVAAGALTGLYKWKHQYIFEDAKGNVIEGQVSDSPFQATLAAQQQTLIFSSAQVANAKQVGAVNGNQVGVNVITVTAGHIIKAGDVVVFFNALLNGMTERTVTATSATTITISGAAVNVNNADGFFTSPYLGIRSDGAVVNGVQANVNTVTVFSSLIGATPNRVRLGDIIFFYNEKIGAFDKRHVTAVTDTTVTFDGDTASFLANTIISCGIYIKVWRNKAGGNLFYETATLANNYQGTFTRSTTFGGSYSDNKADTDLGVQLIDNEIGQEADIPPKSRFATIHQGTKVASGIDTQPNTVAVYSSYNIEAVPLASNYFDVPSSVNGGISAIASDNDDRLAIFKSNSYYDAAGYLEDGTFSVRTVNEGDYGISSHASIKKISQGIIGVGKLGPVSVNNGTLSPIIGGAISPRFLNNSDIKISQALGFNDYSTESYELYVPPDFVFSSDSPLTNQIHYSMDYKNFNSWFSRDLPASMEPSAGMAIYGDVLYSASRSWGTGARASNPGHVYKRINSVVDESLKYSFNTLAPTYTWRTAWEHLDKPSSYKQFLGVRVYSLPGSYEQHTGFLMTCEVFRNFYEAVNDGVSPSFTFNGTSDFEVLNKVRNLKSRAIQFVFVCSNLGTCPFISGYELLVTPSYDQDDFAI